MIAAFGEHVALLAQILDRRQAIVDRIERTLLNVRDKPVSRSRDRNVFARLLDGCILGVPELAGPFRRLEGQLAAAHLADGFEPVRLDRFVHELDPLELVVRAYRHWDRERWPGHAGRLTYAETIYGVFVLRHLEHLSLRVWDDGPEPAAARIEEVQHLLDRLNEPARPIVLVRDARWLIQTAQGPLTRQPEPYFRIAGQVAASLPAPARLEIHKAGARLAGGHLRSQLRYRSWEAERSADDPNILAVTRNSNSMDMALLVHDLVPLLEAYEGATAANPGARLDLADAILQGLSVDPELFLLRLDLLGPCTVIEGLFVERNGEGGVRSTPIGGAHAQMVDRYGDLIGRLAHRLRDDAAALDPVDKVYSPLGIVYGFVADVLSNMAVSTLLGQPSFGLSLEDMFAGRERLEDKLARATGWRALPRSEGEREHFDHSGEWASQVFANVIGALEARIARPHARNASAQPNGTLYVVPEADSVEPAPEALLPGGAASAQEHCLTSDVSRALASGATARPRNEMMADRTEARFLASAEIDGHWFGVSKVILTLLTSHGQDAVVTGVPTSVLAILRVTCPELVAMAAGRPAAPDVPGRAGAAP